MVTNKDYYAILGVTRDATSDQIKKAYRDLAMKYHPDRNPGKEEWANEKFKEINEAFGVLGNTEKRQQYDRFGTAGTMNDVFTNAQTSATFEEMMREFGGAGLNVDFLERIFGDSFRNSGFTYRVYRSPGGGNITIDDLLTQNRTRQHDYSQPQTVNYELTIDNRISKKGLEKDLTRNGHTLRVKIPKKIKDGTKIKLSNALMTTDEKPGDIIITVKISG
jgi:DnaJ-class molecular chaperone